MEMVASYELPTMRQWGVALLAVVFLAACANDRGQPLNIEQRLAGQGYAIKEQVGETKGKVISWGYVDDIHLIIDSGTRNSYLLTLKSPSFDLSSTANIGFTTHFNNLTDQDKLIVSSPSGVKRSYQIGSLHLLEKISK